MKIPKEAVEAAARAEYEHEFLLLEGTWAHATNEAQALFRQSAAIALEAAAPHMLAEAWDEAIQDADDEGYLYTHQSDALKARNPYRPTK